MFKKIDDTVLEVLDNNDSCNLEELVLNKNEGAYEKHIPVYELNDNLVKVKVGDIEHPMTKEHYIKWIYIKTKNGIQRKNLNYNDKPEASFALIEGDTLISIYAYCNLHGLWVNEIKK